ncbi:CASP-like protein 1E1 [Durio zibethinus]|uniref:CASP-like protein n=1 Tax=Durio zibethinus TaxID=66656 RepID=A0A6P6A5J4_DURZI|nr:CASP-like protein 1E1 [Durio zibethinus]
MDGVGSNVKVVESSRRVRYCDGVLRLLGLLLTLVAAIVTGTNRETKTISISISKTLPTLHVPVTAKWQYMSAFVYFLVSNAIAFSYAAASLVASMAVRNSKDKTAIVLVILDMAIMGLLFSANGAAIAVGILGHDGNSHAQWKKVCNLFGGFCHQMTAAIILSLVGSLVFFWLVALAILNLHKKPR